MMKVRHGDLFSFGGKDDLVFMVVYNTSNEKFYYTCVRYGEFYVGNLVELMGDRWNGSVPYIGNIQDVFNRVLKG